MLVDAFREQAATGKKIVISKAASEYFLWLFECAVGTVTYDE